MKVYKKTIYFLYTIFSVWVMNFAVQKTYHCFFALDQYLCLIDPLFSDAIQTNIEAFVKDFDVQTINTADVACELQTTFPYTDSVIFERQAPGVLQCRVAAMQPWVCINNAWVVTQEGVVVEKQVFADDAISIVPHIRVMAFNEKKPVPLALTECLKELPHDTLNSYQMTWVNEHDITLRDKTQPNFLMQCDNTSLPDHNIMHAYELIKADIQQQPQASWVADVRFKNQIIIRRNSGGFYYGKGV